MEEPLTPREFLSRYNLPQLVRIHEAHRVSLDSTLSSDCSSLKRARSTINSLELSESSSGSCSSTSTMTSESLNCSDSSGIGRSSRHRQIPTKMPERNNNHHNYHLNQHRNHNNHLVNNNNHNGKHKRMTINGAIGLNKLTTSTSSPGIINFSSNNTNKKQSVKTICGINQLIKSSSDQTKQSVNCEELDLDQPFLLYKAYTSRQVIGYTVSPDSSFDSNYFKKVGPNLLIPEGYRGKMIDN